MYKVIMQLEDEYNAKVDVKEDFGTYSKRRVLELYPKALDWRVEEERQNNDKINQ